MEIYTRAFTVLKSCSKEESVNLFRILCSPESSFLFGFAGGDKVQMPEYCSILEAVLKSPVHSHELTISWGRSELVSTCSLGRGEGRQRFVIVQWDNRTMTLTRKYLFFLLSFISLDPILLLDILPYRPLLIAIRICDFVSWETNRFFHVK